MTERCKSSMHASFLTTQRCPFPCACAPCLLARAVNQKGTFDALPPVVHVFYQNPLIVPVKVIHAHTVTKDKLGVLSCTFHPTQPWIFSAGADHSVKLFQNIP